MWLPKEQKRSKLWLPHLWLPFAHNPWKFSPCSNCCVITGCDSCIDSKAPAEFGVLIENVGVRVTNCIDLNGEYVIGDVMVGTGCCIWSHELETPIVSSGITFTYLCVDLSGVHSLIVAMRTYEPSACITPPGEASVPLWEKRYESPIDCLNLDSLELEPASELSAYCIDDNNPGNCYVTSL